MPELQHLTKTRISGEIVSVRFENPENGFAVVKFLAADGTKFPVIGPLAGMTAGQFIEADGYFEDHPEFGKQFRVDSYRIVPPVTAEGIARFLRHSIPGIGPKTAAAIVEKFGKETVTILDLYPGRLKEVSKIGTKTAQKIIAAWKNSKDKRDDLIYLQGLGITPAYCARLFKQYGPETVKIVRENPYRLAEDVDGIGFLKADAIARSIGFAENSSERMQAAAVFALNEMIGEGHVCAPAGELAMRSAKLTGQTSDVAGKGIEDALERRLLSKLDDCIYTPSTARAELLLPRLLAAVAAGNNHAGKAMSKVAARQDLQLDELQKKAVESLFTRPLNIITGGPGVGKTTVVGEIVRRAKAAKLKILLAAPTGRAAKRLSESCCSGAKTIHRLLMFDPATAKFKYNRGNPLECDLLIVDEVSMLDIILATSLFAAVPPDCSVVLVGDADQLPSVGPGNVLADFMASGFFGVTKLTRIFRQSAGSAIITNAHRVNMGAFPVNPQVKNGELTDFYWIDQDDPVKAAAMIETLVNERIPKRFGFDPMNDIQILSPMNRGECGTAALNEKLSSLLRGNEGPSFQFGNTVFKEGDRVMQTSNNYDKNVYNGDLGQIVKLETKAKKFHVCFEDERFVEYSFDEANQLSLAYAITIHKSQGSEFPVVIMPVLTQHFVMLQRNLIYTGMTRARKLLILIGSPKAVEIAVKNTRKRPRFSNLAHRLREAFNGN
ncbi:MAG: ATP-dependent RecD-like DNA helicase [Lentisphaerae bacterium]|nr:ATP-dependent RecD-like DNA helicase [Lentisphaerota bacterium]